MTIRNPGQPSVDPDTGNAVTGDPVEIATAAYLSQQSAHLLSAVGELRTYQDTTITTWTLIYPPAVVVTPASRVIASDGRQFEVIGEPAQRRGLGPSVQWCAVSLHLISDLHS